MRKQRVADIAKIYSTWRSFFWPLQSLHLAIYIKLKILKIPFRWGRLFNFLSFFSVNSSLFLWTRNVHLLVTLGIPGAKLDVIVLLCLTFTTVIWASLITDEEVDTQRVKSLSQGTIFQRWQCHDLNPDVNATEVQTLFPCHIKTGLPSDQVMLIRKR